VQIAKTHGPTIRVQVTPLARPVTRGVFRIRPVPTSVPISMPASGAPDADRWAAHNPKCGCRAVIHRSPLMPNRDQRAPITTHG